MDYKYCLKIKKQFPFIRIVKRRLTQTEKAMRNVIAFYHMMPIIIISGGLAKVYFTIKKVVIGD